MCAPTDVIFTIRPRALQQRQERARHRQLAEHVDVEDFPEIILRDVLDRPRHADARYVHQPIQASALELK
jgi:hypothetical protein